MILDIQIKFGRAKSINTCLKPKNSPHNTNFEPKIHIY